MRRRPISVILVAGLFIAAGIIGLVYHASEFNAQAPLDYGLIASLAVRLLAIVAGVYLFWGAGWARWLAVAWMAYHVVLSTQQSISQFIMHAALLAVIAFVLFRPAASNYFKSVEPQDNPPSA